MESSSSNLEESELQQMQLEERNLHQKYMAWFKELKFESNSSRNEWSKSGNENRSSDNELKQYQVYNAIKKLKEYLVDWTYASYNEYALIFEPSNDSDILRGTS
ncbi:hypothetical protein Tco_0183780 [Tanacetum coccineum]